MSWRELPRGKMAMCVRRRHPVTKNARVVTLAAEWSVELLIVAVLGFLLLPLVPFAGVVPGFPVGALQWLVLRRVVPDTGHWILVTGSAFGVAWLLTLVLGF